MEKLVPINLQTKIICNEHIELNFSVRSADEGVRKSLSSSASNSPLLQRQQQKMKTMWVGIIKRKIKKYQSIDIY